MSVDNILRSTRTDYAVADSAKEIHDRDRTDLHTADFYTVERILKTVCTSEFFQSLDDNGALTYRRSFKSGGDVFAIAYPEGEVQRFTISANKHLQGSARRAFLDIEQLSPEEFQSLENATLFYEHFVRTLDTAQQLLQQDDSAIFEQIKSLQESFREILSIAVTDFPEDYIGLFDMHNSLFVEKSTSPLKINDIRVHSSAFFTKADALQSQLGKQLFNHSVQDSVKENRVEISANQISFDDSFLNTFPEDQRQPWKYDEDLSHCGSKVLVVDAGDRQIPFMMEAKALRALNVPRDRAVLNIAGGCRYNEHGNQTEELVSQVMHAAHKNRLNVAPPGTQSGIGIKMAKGWQEYQDKTQRLERDEKAYFFAVSPGGETFYPGNKNLSSAASREVYAMGPFDHVMTPFCADWNLKGWAKADAQYFQHVEYMEAVYQRLAVNQKRVMLVGNGGLFTIAEVNAALKNDVPVILAEGTGRFADAAIAVKNAMSNIQAFLNWIIERNKIRSYWRFLEICQKRLALKL